MNLSHPPAPETPQEPDRTEPAFQRLQAGDRILVSGRSYTVVPLSQSDCAFLVPSDLGPEETAKFQTTFDAICELAPYIHRMSQRLNDPTDGATLRFAANLVGKLPEFPTNSQALLRNYLFSISKNGSGLHYPRLCQIAPPIPRDLLSAIVEHNAPELHNDPDYSTFMKNAYSSVPLATGGYYLFKNDESAERYHKAILDSKPEFGKGLLRLEELFQKMSHGIALSEGEVDEYDQISINYCEEQRLFLEAKIQAAPNAADAQALSTRVTISIDKSGNFSFETQHYTEVFRADLDAMANILSRAQRNLPSSAPDLGNMLAAYEIWARDRSNDPNWGESLSEWLKIDNAANVLDINMCAEEIGSHIGKKGDFQFTVYQHGKIPEGLKDMWSSAQERANAKGIRLLMLTTLLSAGHSYYVTTLGENLPNAPRLLDGKPLQRTMTFDNVTHKGAFLANVDKIRTVMNLTDDDVDRLTRRRTAVLHVTGHEIGHTFDVDAKPGFISKKTHVAEVDAEASAPYLVALYSPQDAEDMGRQVGCWLPCRRAQQGLGSAHSQSDLVMFEEYRKAGAVEVVTLPEGGAFLRVANQEILEATAFSMALQMRLWQRGVPLAVQSEWLKDVKFDRTDRGQAERITSDVDRRLEEISSTGPATILAGWKKLVNTEVEKLFDLERMREIKKTLDPVLSRLDASLPILVAPGNEIIDSLVKTL